MRPVQKCEWPKDANNNPKIYNPPSIAKEDLEKNLGCYCSYCEVFSSDLEVEHIISQDQDPSLARNWDNYLLSCGRCNGRDNKSYKHIDFAKVHYPHLNNTYISFEYLEGGMVRVNNQLTGESRNRAEVMLNIFGLDKHPGNDKYPRLLSTDTRWRHRRTAWEWAVQKLNKYKNNDITIDGVVDFALQRGFFSVWFTVFKDYPDVKEALIESFAGTARNCFDRNNNYNPIPRNPNNRIDDV